jgi:rod shape-determining protein MreC
VNNLVAFIAKYYHWFLFAVLEAASLALLIQFNSYHGSVYFTTANDVAGKLYEANSAIEEFFSLTKNNAQLTQRNLYLERQVKVMSEQLAQLTKDSSYLRNSQLALLSDYRLIPAKVITNSISKRDN